MKIKPISLKEIAKYVLFIALFVVAWNVIPVPSKATPDAHSALNSWANSWSPRIAASGFKSAVSQPGENEITALDPACSRAAYPTCQVYGTDLAIVRSSSHMCLPEGLTFAYDNIVAIGVVWLAVLIIYAVVFCLEWRLRFFVSIVIAALTGSLFFAIGFALRNFLFGIYVVSHPASEVAFWDGVSRFALPFLLLSGWVIGYGIANLKKQPILDARMCHDSRFCISWRHIILGIFLFLPLTLNERETGITQEEISPGATSVSANEKEMDNYASTNKQNSAEALK